jgi:hypothetical protein
MTNLCVAFHPENLMFQIKLGYTVIQRFYNIITYIYITADPAYLHEISPSLRSEGPLEEAETLPAPAEVEEEPQLTSKVRRL